MAIQREFLGWDRAVLPVAAAWLGERFGADMDGLIVAVPAGRAGRRLLELLAERAAANGEALRPPTIVTSGMLPECLFETEEEPADALTATLTRARVLAEADHSLLERLVPHPPEAGDAVAWFGLAEQIDRVSQELAAGRLTPAKVVELAEAGRVDLALSQPRWDALAQLDADFREALGRDDRQSARQHAIENHQVRCEHPVVLVGLVDLTPQLAALLDQLEDLTVLIPAPEVHAAGFDPRGGLVTEYWADQAVDLSDLRFVDQPRDQAIELVRILAEVVEKFPGGVEAQDVTVGLGDEAAAGALGRAVALAGTPTRAAAGRPLRASPAVVLLATLGCYANTQNFADLAALVRHPDLAGVLGDEPWPTRLDHYASRFLAADTRGEWRGDERTAGQLDTLQQRLMDLLPDSLGQHRPLPEWSQPIAEVLGRAYGQRSFQQPRDHLQIKSLQLIADALRQQAAIDPDAPATPSVTFTQAVSLTLARLSAGSIPPRGGESAVELLGFLELPWDDAAHLVIADVNEGFVPESRNADAFLPDGLRRALGLPDNARRYARDVLLMNIIIHSRPAEQVTVLACRRSAAGDPRVPSRLLLACDEATRIARVKDFYAEPADAAAPGPLLLVPGPTSRFLIPRPLLDDPVLEQLSVTAFKQYLACKYRFYLKHVARLELLDDAATEMDALAFGSLTHDVLEDFGKSDAAGETDAAAIKGFLFDRLDTRASGQFGRRPRPAVRVQIEQLRQRLSQFATAQAIETRKGWRICGELIEKKREAVIDVDGEPFTVVGKVDRIDRHPDHGYRVLDYKTSDTAQPPEKTHQKQGQWVDLQLPLYRTLLEPAGIDIGPGAMGYFNLSKSAEGRATGVVMAPWGEDDLAEAMEQRDAVVRGLRGGVFWPPSKTPPQYDDAFTRLAADRALNRDDLMKGEP